MAGGVWDLVSEDGSVVDRTVLFDPAVYELERERIFARTWVAVAHESQLREPGAFVASWVGDEPVLVSRARDGEIHVVLNSCSHRGSRVCRVEAGTSSSWTCPNHGWHFATDGRLLGIPNRAKGYDREARPGLLAARVEVYLGVVFATFDPDARPLVEHLGDATFYLESVLDRYASGLEVLEGSLRSRLECNWKLTFENLGTDLQHPEYAHAAFMDLWPDPVMDFMADTVQVLTSERHPMCLGMAPPPYTEPDLVLGSLEDAAERAEVRDWFERTNREAVHRLGAERAGFYVFTGSVFPSFSFLPGISALFFISPRGPVSTEWWSLCMVPADAPRAVRAFRRSLFQLTAGPGGLILAEDAENWVDMTRLSLGALGRRLPLLVDRGIGEEFERADLPGSLAPMRSEHVQRGFWANWRRAMADA